MKTATEWEKDILNIIVKMNEEFPELSKYLDELPDQVSGMDNVLLNTKNFMEYYNRLDAVLSGYSKTHMAKKSKKESGELTLPGYPIYPPSEDIYVKGHQETALNPENLSTHKTLNEPEETLNEETLNEKDFAEDMSGNDLDVPGSELDDQQESVGSEDEENNHYSLGGDRHQDLDEDIG